VHWTCAIVAAPERTCASCSLEGELLFCAHHGRQHGEALARVATEIQDETDRLSPGKAEAPSH
jgi:hypothetical protein